MREKSPVDGRVVSEVRLPTCDLILLDTLTDGPTCVGWINGHGHTWVKDSLFSWGAAGCTAVTFGA